MGKTDKNGEKQIKMGENEQKLRNTNPKWKKLGKKLTEQK